MMPTDIVGRSAKVAVAVEDGDFPVAAIPARGLPGSAKARVPLRLRTADGVELIAEPAAKGLQKAQDAALAAPGGFWVVQGRLAPDGHQLLPLKSGEAAPVGGGSLRRPILGTSLNA